MLSVLYSEYELWGCPNCGCDSVISSGVSGGGLTSGTCRHCKLKFEVRSENPMGIVKYGCHPENPSDPKSKWVMESAIRIEHPRKGIPAWNWEPVDERPEEGEYWNSRGPGYPDVSGFVKTKAAGERILAMVYEVLGTDKCKTYLDFRPSEPTWIQFKFHKDEFDIEKLDSLTRDSGIITKDIIKQCIYGKGSK